MTRGAGGHLSEGRAKLAPAVAPLADPRWGLLAASIALLALAASVTSLRNGFAYDDRWIIVENDRVHHVRALWRYFSETYWPMQRGAGLYRPFTIMTYSVQWVLGAGSPFIFHLVNVLLAAACAVAVFWTLGFVAPVGAAWLAAALFAVHPVHTEAVANVVGQAELWAALAVLLAVGLYLRDRTRGPLRRQMGAIIVLLFILGLFTKEHVIVLPLLLIVAEAVVFDDATIWRRFDRLRLLLWPIAAVIAVFLTARVQVLGELAGDIPHPSFLRAPAIERAFIMLNVVPEYGRLMLAPMRLYADYSPRQLELFTSPHPTQLAGLLLVACLLALFILAVRRAPVVALGIAWFAVFMAPLSNLAFPTGVLLAERTLFLPSVGAMLVVAYGLVVACRGYVNSRLFARWVVPAGVAAALAFGVGRSTSRNAFWFDSESVFTGMAQDAPLNFKSHYALGGWYFEHGRNRDAEREWQLAIALMPTYHTLYADLGHKYREAHLCNAAIPMYEKALSLEPDAPLATVSLAACQLDLGQWRRARTTSRVAIAGGAYRRAFKYIIDRADSALVANDSLDPTIGARWRAIRAADGGTADRQTKRLVDKVSR